MCYMCHIFVGVKCPGSFQFCYYVLMLISMHAEYLMYVRHNSAAPRISSFSRRITETTTALCASLEITGASQHPLWMRWRIDPFHPMRHPMKHPTPAKRDEMILGDVLDVTPVTVSMVICSYMICIIYIYIYKSWYINKYEVLASQFPIGMHVHVGTHQTELLVLMVCEMMWNGHVGGQSIDGFYLFRARNKTVMMAMSENGGNLAIL